MSIGIIHIFLRVKLCKIPVVDLQVLQPAILPSIKIKTAMQKPCDSSKRAAAWFYTS